MAIDLWKMCRNKKIITFDIFDTLLKRDVLYPGDVFYIVERKFESASGRQESGFANKRKIAERKARGNSRFDEVTFNEIYDCLDFNDSDKEMLKKLELETESELLHGNAAMVNLFNRCIRDKKEIYIISDMYLPLNFLKEVLEREGVTGYKGLILSCEYRKKKRTGDLFKVFLNEKNITHKKIVHIGDSWYADVIGARKAGINGIHIPRHVHRTLYFQKQRQKDDFSQKCLYSFINNRTGEIENRNERVGYEVLGPIILAFCQWVHQYVKQNRGGDDYVIWFAARDMYLFSKTYEKMYRDDNFEYIYLSRKSIRPVYTQAIGDLSKSGEIFPRGKYSFRQIIEYMGYSLEDFDVRGIGSPDIKKYDGRKLSGYQEIKDAILNPVVQTREEELASAGLKYLEEHHLFDRNIFFVDLGWHGTIQYLLSQIKNSSDCRNHLFGLYMGCLDSTNARIGRTNYEAFIFQEGDECWFGRGVLLFECLVLAPHGSTIKYELCNSNIKPVLESGNEICSEIADIQRGALRFIDEYSGNILSQTIELNKESVKKPFEQLLVCPKREELETIGDMEYENYNHYKMASPKKLIYYFLHPSDFVADFKYSPWRIGFLYRLFKIRLPYAKVYAFIRRKQGKLT